MCSGSHFNVSTSAYYEALPSNCRGCYAVIILPMRTLYKVRNPKTYASGEYYQQRIDFKVVDGKEVYYVLETHGYFSDEEKHAVNIVKTLSPDEGFTSMREAHARLEEQIARRIKDGFVHSFIFDPLAEDGIGYEYLGEQK